jgi:predicted DNA binding protein
MPHSDESPVHAELEVEIEDHQCKVIGALEKHGIREFRILDVRGSAEGSIGHLVSLPNSHLDRLEGASAFKVVQSGKETTAWFESEGCEVCNTIVSRGSFLVSGGSIGSEGVSYKFISPNQRIFREIVSELEEKGYKPKILAVERYRKSGNILTGKQELVLWHALKAGFFEYPRKVNTIELSKRLGIVPSTLSEITRRGFRRLLESHFNNEA